jgi:DNA polymerase-3 subunit beta
MKFICTQENIDRALRMVSRISQKHTSLPILENILFRAGNSKVEVMGTNLEIGIQCSFRAKIEKVGEITIPAKIVSGFITNIPSESTIEFTLENKEIIISSGKYFAKIITTSAEDFPIIPQLENEEEKNFQEISSKKFRENITKAMVCVAPNDIRVEFSGVYTCFYHTNITLVSTDSFRLLEIEFEGLKDNQEEKIIIPLRVLSEVMNCLSQVHSDSVKIYIRKSQIFFIINEDVRIISQLISGNFPDYKQIIPKESKTVVDVNVSEMVRAVKLAGIFSQNKTMEVVIRVFSQEKKIEVESKGGVFGKNISTLEAIFIKGVDQEIIFNPKYINDALSLLESENVRIIFTNESSPALLGYQGENDEIKAGLRYILMPIKK